MDDQTLMRLRPTEASTHAIEVAMAAVTEETWRVQAKLEELRSIRPQMLLSATTAQLKANFEAISEPESDLEQLGAIGKELDKQHKLAVDAEKAGERQKQFEAAAAAIEASNAWFKRNYSKHANAIREGLELEQRAIGLIAALSRGPGGRHAPLPEGLPKLARAFVGSEARDFSYLVKLPAAEAGQAIHWQVPRPDYLAQYYGGGRAAA